MNNSSMTALVSAFARARHALLPGELVFRDAAARSLMTDGEYGDVARSMAQGIRFFDPSFSGTEEQALDRIVAGFLGASPLGRAAFVSQALENAVRIGAKQYLIFAAGLDSFAVSQPEWAGGLRIFEIDRSASVADKQARLERSGFPVPENVTFVGADLAQDDWPDRLLSAGFARESISFSSLLGLSYYLPGQAFETLVVRLGALCPRGSALAFDYPDRVFFSASDSAFMLRQLAGGAGEAMQSGWSYGEMEKLLENAGFLIYEHLEPDDITERFFSAYNASHPGLVMRAQPHVNYCLAVRR